MKRFSYLAILLSCIFFVACSSEESSNKTSEPSSSEEILCEDQLRPKHSSWKGNRVVKRVSDCQWECDATYVSDNLDQPTSCVPEESVVSFVIAHLKESADGSKKGINSQDLTLQVIHSSAGGANHAYYVTHKVNWRPNSDKDIELKSGKSWVRGSGNLTAYSLPSGVKYEEYNLYLWIADSQGNVRMDSAVESDSFVLDRQAPGIDVANFNKPTSFIKGSSASVNLPVSGVDLGSKYSYCFGDGCNLFRESSEVQLSAPSDSGIVTASIVVDTGTLSLGQDARDYYITFKVEDWVGNAVTSNSIEFSFVPCTIDDIETENADSVPVFAYGERERSCIGSDTNNDGSINPDSGTWEAWTVTGCAGGYYKDGSGFCIKTTGSSVSAASDVGKVPCAGNQVPSVHRTSCVNCPAGQHALGDNSGCTSNVRICPGSAELPIPSYAMAASQIWVGGRLGDWEDHCVATACIGSHSGLYNGVCYANERDCNVEISSSGSATIVGSGKQSYISGGLYSACKPNACIGGYDTVDSESALDGDDHAFIAAMDLRLAFGLKARAAMNTKLKEDFLQQADELKAKIDSGDTSANLPKEKIFARAGARIAESASRSFMDRSLVAKKRADVALLEAAKTAGKEISAKKMAATFFVQDATEKVLAVAKSAEIVLFSKVYANTLKAKADEAIAHIPLAEEGAPPQDGVF